ncbi:MAG: sugar transferase [Anaerolineae bacterium]|nr:sugar transferase [Anaerolineae bacterium]
MNGNTALSERQQIESRWLMPVVDVLLVFVAFGIAYYLRYQWQVFRPVFDPSRSDFFPYLPYAALYALVMWVNYRSNGLYKQVRGRAWLEEVVLIGNGVTTATVILLAVYFALQPLVTSRLMLAYVAGISLVLLAVARIIRRMVLAHFRNKGIGVHRVLIVGMGDVGQSVLRTLVSRRELGYTVVGYLDDNPERGEVDLGRVSGLGKIENLENVILAQGIDLVIVTLRWEYYDTIIEIARTARQEQIDVRVVPDIFQLNLRQVQVENLDGIPLLGIGSVPELRGASRLLKRVLDMAIVLLAAPLWLLFLAVISIAIKLEDGGSILYKTKRVGEHGREFFMYKFRSMIPDADKYRQQLIAQHEQDPRHPKIVDDPRITKVGKFIRRTSLDELPNLLNVLRGEMSLVGPRPPLPDEVALYEQWHRQRLQTIPGITGLWQVSGRSEVPFDEMVLMDIYYIENWSVLFDVQILFMTIPKVLLRRGAY